MKKLLTIMLTMMVSTSLWATHFVGGNFSICQTGANDFEVTLRVYRDCAPGNSTFIDPSSINVFDNVTNGLVMNFSMSSSLVSQTVLTLGDSCYTPTGICVEEYVYVSTITLADNPNGYYLEWDDCCRNSLIDNLASPSSDGMTYYVQIPDPALAGGNCTPDFGSYPTNGYLCINFDQEIDFEVTDPDGDSLVFSLIDPFDEASGGPKPFPTCGWATGYSLANILGNVSNPPMTIDSQTGVITCHPEIAGVFVFSVMVKEYRNGVQIGEVVRDVQYTSLACTIDSPPVITLADSIDVFVDDSICIDMYVYDNDGTDTIYLNVSSSDFDLNATYVEPIQMPDSLYYPNWQGSGNDLWFPHLDSANNAMQGVGEIPMRFCWMPGCNDLDSIYHMDLIAYSIGCSGSDTATSSVAVHVVHNPPPVLLNIPDTMQLFLGETICLEMFAQDTANPLDTLSLLPLSGSFDFASTYIQPSYFGTNANGTLHYYTNFQGTDTLWLENFGVINNAPSAQGSVALRYCWTTDCDAVFQQNYDLTYMGYSTACGSDTVYKSSHIEVEPPVGYVEPIPNIFTPNDDGQNDFYRLRGQNDPCYDFMLVQIYNRWGQMVYQSDDPLFSWDGTNYRNGKNCAEGIYYVLIDGSYGSVYDPITGERIPTLVKDEYYIQLLR